MLVVVVQIHWYAKMTYLVLSLPQTLITLYFYRESARAHTFFSTPCKQYACVYWAQKCRCCNFKKRWNGCFQVLVVLCNFDTSCAPRPTTIITITCENVIYTHRWYTYKLSSSTLETLKAACSSICAARSREIDSQTINKWNCIAHWQTAHTTYSRHQNTYHRQTKQQFQLNKKCS